MIEWDRVGDLLEQKDVTHILHQANLYHVFGSGIARQIRERFPKAFEADRKTHHGDLAKLGTFSSAKVSRSKWVINLYSQRGISSTERTTDYSAMTRGLDAVRDYLVRTEWPVKPIKLGIPYKLGCGLAGGDWAVVRALIYYSFESTYVNVAVVKLPEITVVRAA